MLKNPNYKYGENSRKIFASLHLGEFMLKVFWENRDKVALVNGETGESTTFGNIAQESMNVAVSLTRMGVRKGDVVAVSCENRREFWATVIGIICTGAIASTINTGYTRDELIHVMNIAKPKIIFCSPPVYQRHGKIYKSIKFLKKIILYGEERIHNGFLYNDIAIANNGYQNNDKNNVNILTTDVRYEDFVCVDVKGQEDPALILYSSGTTGMPKGVKLSHLNVIVICSPAIKTAFDMEFCRLSITPWYHTMGLVGNLSAFASSSKTVYLPKFDVRTYLETIEKYKVTSLSVVPSMLVELCKSNIQCDTSSVFNVFCGAAPLYEETVKAVKKRFPSAQAILQGYGLTETTLAVTFNADPERYGSVGTVIENCVVKVVDPKTKEVLGPRKEGEICAKGAVVMLGYVGKDRREDFDEEDFFRTGDLGYFDEDGYFYIVDRLKELIKYKGYQVAPAEVEAVLLKHEGIKDAAVVGRPDLASGELPLAFVVKQPGVELTEKEVQEYVAERLSNPKRLRGGVRFVNEIPKNPTGKILRRELKKMVKADRSKL